MLDQGGATWLPLDPWIATDESWPDRRIVDEMDLNGNEFRQSFLGGEFCTGALDQPGACSGLVEALRTEVDAWLADHGEPGSFDGHTNVRDSAIYRRLMADAIPALSNPTGGNGKPADPAVRDGGFKEDGIFAEIKDLSDYKRGWYRDGDWPRRKDRWKHGDLKVIAYPFNHGFFDAIVHFIETGSLEE